MTADRINELAGWAESEVWAALDGELDCSSEDAARAAVAVASAIRDALAHHLTGWDAIRWAESTGATVYAERVEGGRGRGPVTAEEAVAIAAEDPSSIFIPRIP